MKHSLKSLLHTSMGTSGSAAWVVIGEPIWVNDPTDPAIRSKSETRHAVRVATERLSIELQRLFDEAQSRVG